MSFDLIDPYPIADDDAFAVVDRAVWYVLWCNLGTAPPRDQVPGGTCYSIRGGDILLLFFVLRIAEHMAHVRIHLKIPHDPIEHIVWKNRLRSSTGLELAQIAEALSKLQLDIKFEVEEKMHQAMDAGALAPPPPKDTPGVVRWWQLYYRDLSAAQMSDLLAHQYKRQITGKTLSNEKSNQIHGGAIRTNNRGRPPRNNK